MLPYTERIVRGGHTRRRYNLFDNRIITEMNRVRVADSSWLKRALNLAYRYVRIFQPLMYT